MKRFTDLPFLGTSVVLLALAGLLACGGSSAPKDAGTDGCAGASCGDVADAGDPGVADDGIQDRADPDPGTEDEGVSTDVEQCGTECDARPFGIGCPCTAKTDCEGDWCVAIPGGSSACSQTCIENCPCGWVCKNLVAGESIFVCVPDATMTCSECLTDGTCSLGGMCVTMGTKHFCVDACAEETGACADGYECKEVTNKEGTITRNQCMPVSGHCQCGPDVDYQVGVPDPKDGNKVLHCGDCETTCAFANSVSYCNAGECTLNGCLENFMNLDQKDENGCEYPCTFRALDDRPDPDSVGAGCPGLNCFDANCDGIDGVDYHDGKGGVFVDTTVEDGDASNFIGDRAHPFTTITAALLFAITQPDRKDIYVSAGTYAEQVSLESGINLYGGYDSKAGWTRNIAKNVTSIQWSQREQDAVRSVIAVNIIDDTTFDGFSVRTGRAADFGASSYGMTVFHCSNALKITNNTIEPGRGADGLSGKSGADQPGGKDGAKGSDALVYDGCGICFTCQKRDFNTYVVGGAGGTSPCGMEGGKGGQGGHIGDPGYIGFAGPNGGGAAGQPGPDTQDAGPGGVGADGALGQDGGGGGEGGDFNPINLYLSLPGANGADGQPGKGGGGGGGGGGDADGFLGIACYSAGGGGGGGGGGGCGGAAGKGGTGGGGSFGIYVVESNPVIRNNKIYSNSGGNGGNGGTAGGPGLGGLGGAGGTRVSDHAGAGGRGGDGGKGGEGGAGGGGAGGPSFPLYIRGTDIGPTCDGNVYEVKSDPGVGGAGGAGNSNRGADGASGNIFGGSATCQ